MMLVHRQNDSLPDTLAIFEKSRTGRGELTPSAAKFESVYENAAIKLLFR